MRALALVALCAGCAAPTGLAGLHRDARNLTPLVSTPLAQAFVRAVDQLPHIIPRDVAYVNRDGKPVTQHVDEEYYYTTRYGTPLAYARPLDLSGLASVRGARILDFGYGNIGQLLMLAALGAEPTGVDVDPLLPILYAGNGHARTLSGHLPALRDQLGGNYTLIISKNTLKRGYVHPAQPVTDRERVDLGSDDETFLKTVYELLAPGGRFLIYNLCPAPAPPGKKYIPWADGRSPFPRQQLEQLGFRVVAFETDDTPFARRMARALGWNRGPDAMDVDHDLFAWFTLVEKP